MPQVQTVRSCKQALFPESSKGAPFTFPGAMPRRHITFEASSAMLADSLSVQLVHLFLRKNRQAAKLRHHCWHADLGLHFQITPDDSWDSVARRQSGHIDYMTRQKKAGSDVTCSWWVLGLRAWAALGKRVCTSGGYVRLACTMPGLPARRPSSKTRCTSRMPA